ncbi:MAG: 4-hydroxythreonine-4-phosphate dehydrogenase PdxA [Hyphomicrobium sp.]|jgi:4-hydroxythreonine-4-phosphate dehydrogenase
MRLLHEASLPPLALTMGDPAGIGLEIALMAWRQRNERNLPPFVLFADLATLRARVENLMLDVPLVPVDDLADGSLLFTSALPVSHVALEVPALPGRPDPRNGPPIVAAIERATAAVIDGRASAVVTNPIAKSVLKKAGFAHPGHTEFLAHLASLDQGMAIKPVMMLAADELRVVPLTVHIPLARVPGSITRELLLETLRTLDASLQRDFGIAAPRIAVTGLNPHAGEEGVLGSEEQAVIIPALDELRRAGYAVTGPHPADTLFHEAQRATYDAVLAMYHDQALIPLKTLAFDRGVNVTLGLPFVRTSPDHGTAFDIAGRGIASPASLIEALLLAQRLARRRALARST